VLFIRTLGGAVVAIRDDETAFAHRSANFNLSVDSSWTDPALDAAAIGWARSTWDALAPFASGGVYINFAGLDNDSDRRSVLGRNQERLDSIRTQYDPEGLFEEAAFRP
jgi:hypothetical protein